MIREPKRKHKPPRPGGRRGVVARVKDPKPLHAADVNIMAHAVFSANCRIRGTTITAVFTKLMERWVRYDGHIPEYESYKKRFPLSKKYLYRETGKNSVTLRIPNFPRDLHDASTEVADKIGISLAEVVRWLMIVFNAKINTEKGEV